jgi:hypothetical protein
MEAALERDITMTCRVNRPHRVQPWRAALREREHWLNLARGQEMFSQRVRRAVEEELRAETPSGCESSTNGGRNVAEGTVCGSTKKGITSLQY